MTDSPLERLAPAIKTGKRKDARAATAEALDTGLAPQSILDALTVGTNDVRKNLLMMMLKGANFEVIDLGAKTASV
ncbi:MAG: methanogenic corrinoid protein MtbC1 [Lentimonas sp.]|jgi:methanogenic corrinoid protein MtbC1